MSHRKKILKAACNLACKLATDLGSNEPLCETISTPAGVLTITYEPLGNDGSARPLTFLARQVLTTLAKFTTPQKLGTIASAMNRDADSYLTKTLRQLADDGYIDRPSTGLYALSHEGKKMAETAG